ncbi:MAG: universal stress protein [Nitrosomonadaceae bacterium]|nr:universal stress protein [Nitrosomonadaceae bacterium]
MYQRILIPVDGSPTSDRALQEALRLAQQQNAQLLLLHVIEEIRFVDIESSINYAELLESMRNSGTKILTQAQTVVQQAGMTAEVKLLEAGGERVASVIVAEAERWPADLIVIGTHGRSGFSRLLFGSVAEGVVRTAQVPVLLIRGG